MDNLYGILYSDRYDTTAVAYNNEGELGKLQFGGDDETERNKRASDWLTTHFGIHVNAQSVESPDAMGYGSHADPIRF